MSMRYDAQSHNLVLTAADGEGAVLPILLANLCTCGAILRAYVELPNTTGLSLETYLDWREAARYEARKQGKYLILFPRAYQDEPARCCRREKYLAFALEPAIERWLQRREVAADRDLISRIASRLPAYPVPGFGLIRDELTGSAMGFTWHEKAVYGGARRTPATTGTCGSSRCGAGCRRTVGGERPQTRKQRDDRRGCRPMGQYPLLSSC